MEVTTKPKREFPIIEVPPSGKSGMMGGAWCLVWVYSNKGNFLLKGYMKECEDYIKMKGWKCWAIFNLYCGKNIRNGWKGGYRTIIETFMCNFKIHSPSVNDYSGKKKSKDWKFIVYKKENWKNNILIKRLPQRFVDFDFTKNRENDKI